MCRLDRTLTSTLQYSPPTMRKIVNDPMRLPARSLSRRAVGGRAKPGGGRWRLETGETLPVIRDCAENVGQMFEGNI